MPGGDRTGPLGEGVGTGRRAGLCYGSNQPGYASSGGIAGGGAGRGFRGRSGRFGNAGRGRGQGIGMRFRGTPAAPVNEASDLQRREIAELREQNRQIAEALGEIQKRLDDIQSGRE